MIAAIALGSNLKSPYGDPADNLHEALRRLASAGRVVAVSGFHLTDPIGYTDQPQFVNAAALLQTELKPLALLHVLMGIEKVMGRDRSACVPLKGPRVIDLDLLLMEERNTEPFIIYNQELKLPHTAMHEREFVLAPLAEIAPRMKHPVFLQTVQQMLAALPAKEPYYAHAF